MSDNREAILERLVAIGQGLDQFNLVGRNKIVPADTQLPALIVLDGTEEADEKDPRDMRPATAPRRVRMRAVLQLILQGLPENAGTILNGFRQAVLNAVFTDTVLLGVIPTAPGQTVTPGLVLDNRAIRYLGCDTGFDMGRQLEASMWLHIEFTYALTPGTI